MLLDISTSNKLLAPYLMRTYSEDKYWGIKDSSLAPALKDGLGLIYRTITGEDLADNSTSIGFTVKNGAFSRMYGPTVYKRVTENVPSLAVKWGDKFIGFKMDRKGAILWDSPAEWVKFPDTEAEDGNYYELTCNIIDAEINGYKAVCLQVDVTQVDKDKDEVVDTTILNIPFRFVDLNKTTDASQLKLLFKTSVEEAFELLSEPVGANSFVKPYELVVGQYEIVGIAKFASKKKAGEYSIAVHLADGNSIWLPSGMIDVVLPYPDDIKGRLTITEADVENKQVSGVIGFGDYTPVPFKLDPPTSHMRFLGVGEFVMTDYYMPPNSQYASYVVTVEGHGRYYCPKGIASDILNSSPDISKANPAKLIVTSVEEKTPGKWSVKCHIQVQSAGNDDMLDLI